MSNTLRSLCAVVVVVLPCALAGAQATNSTPSPGVPELVRFSARAVDEQGKPVSGIVGLTIAIYSAQQGGSALWIETQNATPDGTGNYSVQLGSTQPNGLPLDLFTSGEARWVGVRVNGGEEQPRVLLLSVPYALKAADAQTLGGLPPSAFMLATPPTASAPADNPISGAVSSVAPPPASSDVTTTGGSVNTLPLFTTATNVQNSIVTQTGTTTINVGGKLILPATGAATASKGFSSRPLDFVASSYNSSTAAPVTQTFQWQAEQANNNTANPSGILTLLYGSGTTAPAETGLRIGPKGILSFVPGQTFPGAGTITGVTAGTDLTGGGTTGNVTLNLDTTQVPQLSAANTFAGTQTVNGNLSANSASNSYPAITGNDSSSGGSAGVVGNSTAGYGVSGNSTDSYGLFGNSTYNYGVDGVSTFGTGVNGFGATGVQGTGAGTGVQGVANAASGFGVSGVGDAAGVVGTGNNYGVEGDGPIGLYGFGGSIGVDGVATSNGGYGVQGTGTIGVVGESGSTTGSGGSFSNSTTGDALFAYNQDGGYAAFFDGNVDVDGKLSKAGGSFKIDHPLDPANKYLSHSFVESPDMMNIYNGNATLDANGEATVEMPDWFGVLNRDFRYQLTCIGGFAPVYIAEKLTDNRFKIGGGRAGLEVSWQITGIRQDAWANANRIPVEEEKEAKLKGFYLHPQLYGAPAEKGIAWARHPEMMKKLQQDQKQMREKQAGLTGSPATATPAPLIPPAAPPRRIMK